MKKLLLILLCLPIIGFGQEEIPINTDYDFCNYLYKDYLPSNNVYNININSNNQLLVEGEMMQISDLKAGAKKFINNNGMDARYSDNPEVAFFWIMSRGSKTIDYEIISIIRNAYSILNIDIHKRKICYMRDKEIKIYKKNRRLTPPPPPPR